MKTKILFILFMIFSACQEESLRVAQNVKIGDFYEGGIVFYIFQEGEIGYVEDETHGLIVAEQDIESSKWGCENAPLIEFTTDGDHNTSVILNYCSNANAAYYCSISTIGDQFDWYLPSRQEFELLLSSTETFYSTDYYWTSNKFSSSEAVCIRPSDGNALAHNVNYTHKVRPIHKF